MFFKKENKSADEFWQEYEEKINEKVLERGLGMYIFGWQEFDDKRWNNLWGLVIKTSGGFRFHHFPRNSWLENLAGFGSKQAQEKIIFVPQEKIISSSLVKETRWWKKLFNSSPRFVIEYTDDGGGEAKIVFEILAGTFGEKKI